MAITTIDGALAGMQPPRFFNTAITPTLVVGRPHSTWMLAGIPGAGTQNATLNGANLSSTSATVPGQIPFGDSATSAYLARFMGHTTGTAGTLLLVDRLWSNGGYTITSTSAQNSTTAAWPSRDANGSTNGDGVILGVEISVATGAGTPTITVAYTNQAGTATRSATNVIATAASSAIGAFYPIGLQAGDTGVRSVQSLTLSATWTSGTMHLVAYRVLASLELSSTNIPNGLDAITGGFPKMYNGSVPFLLFIPTATTAATTFGSIVYSHG